MTLPSLKIFRCIRQLFRLIGSSNANEAASAREKLVTLLTKHGLSWNDILSVSPRPTPLTSAMHLKEQRLPVPPALVLKSTRLIWCCV